MRPPGRRRRQHPGRDCFRGHADQSALLEGKENAVAAAVKRLCD